MLHRNVHKKASHMKIMPLVRFRCCDYPSWCLVRTRVNTSKTALPRGRPHDFNSPLVVRKTHLTYLTMMSTTKPNAPMTGKRDEQKEADVGKEQIGDDTTKTNAQIVATSTDGQVGFSLPGLNKLLGPLGI